MKNRMLTVATRRQKGTVLIIGLVLLMALTIVGVSMMSDNSLQSRMAGNLVDSNLAFNAAETAARALQASLNPENQGESNCQGRTFDGTPAAINANHTCILELAESPNIRVDMNWMVDEDHIWWTSHTGGGINFVQEFTGSYTAKIAGYDLIKTAPRAIVEMHSQNLNQVTLDRRNLTTPSTTYRVTVRGTGSSDNSQALIQQFVNKHL